MFSALRRRLHLTPSTMIATLALVFAMSGGAYAASKYVITSTRQISPKVLKSLTGKAGASGAAGKPGVNGANGATGPQGPAGATGATGGAGKEGPAGKEGVTGKEGTPGTEGSPWTAGGKLPSKKTETGAWSATAGPFNITVGSVALAPISFTVPLAHAPRVKIEAQNYDGNEAECPSNTNTELEAGVIPKAAPGVLCVYAINGQIAEDLTPLVESASGAVLLANLAEAQAGTVTYGVWAVTAE